VANVLKPATEDKRPRESRVDRPSGRKPTVKEKEFTRLRDEMTSNNAIYLGLPSTTRSMFSWVQKGKKR
jgi:hypothetical protein